MAENVASWFASGAWLAVAWDAARAVVIVGVAYLASRLLRMSMERLRRRVRDSDADNIIYVVEKIGGYIIIVVGVMVALSTVGVNLESFTLFAGALGVGAGLGLQGIVKELFSGLVLIFNPSMRVGDFIELEDGTHGEIVEIGTRSTRLRNNDYVNILVPNSTMVQSRVINWTYSEAPRRLHVPFSVIETADKARVRDVVLKAAWKLPFTLPDTDARKTQVWLKDRGRRARFRADRVARSAILPPPGDDARGLHLGDPRCAGRGRHRQRLAAARPARRAPVRTGRRKGAAGAAARAGSPAGRAPRRGERSSSGACDQ
jgi:small-conductance mechanosensitive channel